MHGTDRIDPDRLGRYSSGDTEIRHLYLSIRRYDNILRLSDDPDVNDVIKFLREREVVHFQRFGEAVQLLREKLDQKNVYFMNPALDM